MKNDTIIKDTRQKIIKKRISWVIGRWIVNVKENEVKSDLYKILLSNLNENDLVIQLTTINSINSCIYDDDEFNIDLFNDYFDNFLDRILILILKLEEEDTKLNLFSLLINLLDRLGNRTRFDSILKLIKFLPVKNFLIHFLGMLE
jgi:hypothetical protein